MKDQKAKKAMQYRKQQKQALELVRNYGNDFIEFLKDQCFILGFMEASAQGVLPLFKKHPGCEKLPKKFLMFLTKKHGNLPKTLTAKRCKQLLQHADSHFCRKITGDQAKRADPDLLLPDALVLQRAWAREWKLQYQRYARAQGIHRGSKRKHEEALDPPPMPPPLAAPPSPVAPIEDVRMASALNGAGSSDAPVGSLAEVEEQISCLQQVHQAKTQSTAQISVSSESSTDSSSTSESDSDSSSTLPLPKAGYDSTRQHFTPLELAMAIAPVDAAQQLGCDAMDSDDDHSCQSSMGKGRGKKMSKGKKMRRKGRGKKMSKFKGKKMSKYKKIKRCFFVFFPDLIVVRTGSKKKKEDEEVVPKGKASDGQRPE